MLFLFKKNKKPKEYKKAEKAAVYLSKKILALQIRWANWLSRRERKMTIRQKKIALAIFCIAMTGVSGSALYQGLLGHQDSSFNWLRPQTITPPNTVPLPDSLEIMYLYELEKKRNAENRKQDSIK